MVKPFPNALKNDVWRGAGLTFGAVASAMLIVDSGNREGGCDSVGDICCFDTPFGQHTLFEQEGF